MLQALPGKKMPRIQNLSPKHWEHFEMVGKQTAVRGTCVPCNLLADQAGTREWDILIFILGGERHLGVSIGNL